MLIKTNILIIEDDQFLREFYQELLQSEGFLIDLAPDGDIASQKLAEGGYDLVMLDIMLEQLYQTYYRRYINHHVTEVILHIII